MADAEIQVVITAIDEMSATVKKIESTLTSSSKNIKATTENTGRAFTSMQGQILILGQTVQKVDTILSQYTNLQIRIENATERVTGAHERLIAAQEKLRDSQDRLNEARQSSERANLSLEKLGIEEIRSKEKLRELNSTLSNLMERRVLPNSYDYQETLKKIQDEELNLRDIQLSSKELQQKSIDDLNKAHRDTVSAQRDVESATRGVTIAENNLERANNAVVGTYISMGLNAITAIAGLNQLTQSSAGATSQVKMLGSVIGTRTAGAVLGGLGTVGLIAGMLLVLKEIDTQVQQDQIRKLREETALLGEAADSARKQYVAMQQTMYPSGGTAKTKTPEFNAGPVNINSLVGGNQTVFRAPFQDFIMRPGQNPQPFSPSDTIIGTKGGAGTSIIINGDNYGVDADEIARALYRKLKMRTSI